MLTTCLQKVDKENIGHSGDFVHKVHGEGCSAELKELKMTLAMEIKLLRVQTKLEDNRRTRSL